jgi:hypothetical protein
MVAFTFIFPRYLHSYFVQIVNFHQTGIKISVAIYLKRAIMCTYISLNKANKYVHP